jgi:hypothetical protein
LGRGRGRCCELVSSLGTSRGDASGDDEGEGEDDAAPSGREDDMLAAVVRIVLRWLDLGDVDGHWWSAVARATTHDVVGRRRGGSLGRAALGERGETR